MANTITELLDKGKMLRRIQLHINRGAPFFVGVKTNFLVKRTLSEQQYGSHGQEDA
jgi:hypothetical protein